LKAVRRSGALAVTIALFTLSACGGDEADPPDVPGVGQARAGSVAQLASCADWNEGSVEERLATIEEVRGQINLEEGTVRTPALSDQEAYDFFERACAPDYATGFRLYKIYARAAAFQSLQ
jgi:hypothetical protein